MKIIREYWAIIVATTGAWLSCVDNLVLNKIVNLLTITVLSIGLVDWAVRRIRGTVNKRPGKGLLGKLEATQRPFKAVNILENPIEPGEKIGNFVDKIYSEFKGDSKMKKVFKWVWYNKEQLGSILYSVAILALSQLAVWTDLIVALLPVLPPAGVLAVEITVCVLSVGFTALTVRNVCVKYGLSSLETIDQVLAERAQTAMNELTPEQKKTLKSYISTLQQKLNQTNAERKEAEKAIEEMTTLFNADHSLVADFTQRKAELATKINRAKEVASNIEAKIAEYEVTLNGKSAAGKE